MERRIILKSGFAALVLAGATPYGLSSLGKEGEDTDDFRLVAGIRFWF